MRFFTKLGDWWRYINSKWYLLLAFYTVIALLWYIGYNRQEKKIKEFANSNLLVTGGYVDSASYSGYPNWKSYVYYTFSKNQRIIHSYRAVEDIKYNDVKSQVVQGTFPVYYNEEKQTLLITPNDFERMDLPFPDSLEWVKEIVDPSAEPFF